MKKIFLIALDIIILIISSIIFFFNNDSLTIGNTFILLLFSIVILIILIIINRLIFKIYKTIWKYADSVTYIKLIFIDIVSLLIFCLIDYFISTINIKFVYKVYFLGFELSLTLFSRYLYITIANKSLLNFFFMHGHISNNSIENKIRIGIIGAGTIGALLAEELIKNEKSIYKPICFIDNDKSKIGNKLCGIKIISGKKNLKQNLINLGVQEVVFTINRLNSNESKLFYEKYTSMGFKVKVYNYPLENSIEAGKRLIREFDPEELLFRQKVNFIDEEINSFYKNKIILITGGGGSIGSELSRQIAKMSPQNLILVDNYENNLYDIQQELKLTYGDNLKLNVEIADITKTEEINLIFKNYKPEIILHAAAHKHVPLMEHNCCEAIQNNIFGTLNVVKASIKYHSKKFIMISTDKAVNPTSVMGATKRMCELIVRNYASIQNNTSFSSVRFGNVLGSSGSVIPLFKRQIANGGPITITDKRIIRYFMTIPEASQLVLVSGAMAKSGELFVLDMGKPVKILDLAENMIRLSGLEPYNDIDIKEIGLRPGEKLYEELLVNPKVLTKTKNKMIFVENDLPITTSELNNKLKILQNSLKTNDNDAIKNTLKKVIPSYK